MGQHWGMVWYMNHKDYYLKPTQIIFDAVSASSSLASWSSQVVQTSIPKLVKLKTLHCESCQLIKHVWSQVMVKLGFTLLCLSYPQVWGPSRVFTSSSYKYFVTIIDDFARCTWMMVEVPSSLNTSSVSPSSPLLQYQGRLKLPTQLFEPPTNQSDWRDTCLDAKWYVGLGLPVTRQEKCVFAIRVGSMVGE